jgi:hypothetical protein
VIVAGVSAGRGRGHRVIFRVNLPQHSRKGIIAMTAPHMIDPAGMLGQAPMLVWHLASILADARRCERNLARFKRRAYPAELREAGSCGGSADR